MSLNIGSMLSSIIGNNKKVRLIEGQQQLDKKFISKKYRSPTTNSYDICLDALTNIFSQGLIDIAKKSVEKYDKVSFQENILLKESNLDVHYIHIATGVTGKITLVVKGEYKFKYVCHCKTIEMWLEIETNTQNKSEEQRELTPEPESRHTATPETFVLKHVTEQVEEQVEEQDFTPESRHTSTPEVDELEQNASDSENNIDIEDDIIIMNSD